MSRRTASQPAAARRAAGAPLDARAAAVPLTHPVLIAAALAVAVLVVAAVTYPLDDPDLFQHLTVGRAIWTMHAIPRVHLWSWPTYGIPQVLPSWAFRALLWPVYAAAGVKGLFAWRWLTTLAAFGLVWAAARALGARGFVPLPVIALGAFVYRGRSKVRPETLVAPLLAGALALLEWRRAGGRLRIAGREIDPAWLLVPIAWGWANVHLSYWLIFLLIGAYALHDELAKRADRGVRFSARTEIREAAPRPARTSLFLIGAMAAAACFLNPFGWRALWQPFEYFLFWRNEAIYKSITELGPVDWSVQARTGLPLLAAGWPLLVLARFARGRRDAVELLLCPVLVYLTLTGQRFMGFLGVAAVPFVARDLAEWCESRASARAPRAGLAVFVSLLLAIPSLGFRWSETVRGGFDLRRYPVAACDFLAANGVRGRIYNSFFHGGYLLWRFWPDRGRLPFMDIHQSGTREDRDGQAYAPASEEWWQALDRRRDFELILYPRYDASPAGFLDRRDRDSTWALVFVDDAAALYARRIPRYASLIARCGYRRLTAGEAGLASLGSTIASDTTARREAAAELSRVVATSRASSRARYLLGTLAASAGRLDQAADDFRAALAADPEVRRAHEGLGAIAAARAHPAEAIAEFQRERTIGGWLPGLGVRLGAAYRAEGDVGRARLWYGRELERDPGSAEARDSLAALGGAR